VAVLADDSTATHASILATVGGVLTFGINSGGSGYTSGATLVNVPMTVNSAGSMAAGVTMTLIVSGNGIATVASGTAVFHPGYGARIGDTFAVQSTALAGNVGGGFAIVVSTVLPCTPPFPLNTKYIEMSCDANGPANITLDSTLTSVGFTNSILTTEQSTLTTQACRLATNERLLRRVPIFFPPAAAIPNVIASQQQSLVGWQVIMGTAAA
jgi:hypothetical protein